MTVAKTLHIDAGLVDKALSLWRQGEVIIFPTETVYGLGADAGNDEAVAKLYAIKSRPQDKAITVHVTDAAMAQRYVEWTAQAERLAARFWPGPLSMVLKKKSSVVSRQSSVSALASASGETLAVRAPSHPIAQQLIRAFGSGVAGTSANRSGQPAPVTVAQAHAELGALFSIDGGNCAVGVASTVIDMTGDRPRLLRAGSITLDSILAALQ